MRKLTLASLVVSTVIALPVMARSEQRSLLKTADLSCAGVFLSPAVPQGGHTTVYPVAYRYENGARHYFIYGGDAHIYQFPEPTLAPCSTPLNAIPHASFESWGGDWGRLQVNANGHYTPGRNSTMAHRLYYDAASSQLILSWYPAYAAVTFNNSFAGVTLNSASRTMTLNGCWGIPAHNTVRTGSGVMAIPPSFVSQHLPAGRRWAVGFGGSLGYAVANSYGPFLTAINPPAANPCAPDTDYDVTSSTLLESHLANGNGPNCSTRKVGCTPSRAPSAPFAARQAFANYSVDMYVTTWDPYDGRGFFTWDTFFSMDWYDDGAKHGIVVPLVTPSGWLNTTVSASPAPTANTFTIPTVDMHDGAALKAGDIIWVQTCTPGAVAGCATLNNNHLAFARVTSATATGAITFSAMYTDGTGANHPPVEGGAVYAGCIYAHGTPTCTRYTWRMQIYDPSQYAEVIRGSRHPSEVTYAEDADFTKIISHFGVPMSNPGYVGGTQPIATMADPAAKQIMIAVANAKPGGGGQLIYVLNVGQR